MKKDTAIFAGGCFWCMVQPFDSRPGVISVVSGYTGGWKDHPTYEEVCSHKTGHVEAVEITFDTDKISYNDLLNIYWQVSDPTDSFGQFQDRGETYQTVIFVNSPEQRKEAEASKKALQDSKRFGNLPIVTKIEDASTFWPAEDYHQDFYLKNPLREALADAPRKSFEKKYWKDKK